MQGQGSMAGGRRVPLERCSTTLRRESPVLLMLDDG